METVSSIHLYVRKQYIMCHTPELPDHFLYMPAFPAADTVAFKHLSNDSKLERVIINQQHILRQPACDGRFCNILRYGFVRHR